MHQKQTYDDKYVDFSRVFQEKTYIFLCFAVYLDLQKSNSIQIFVSKGNTALGKNASCFESLTRMQNKCTPAQTGQRPCILH